MRLHFFAAALVAVAAAVHAQQPDPHLTVTVGTASARRGLTAYGAINVPAGSDSGLTMPVAVVNGARPGPVVAFVAGSHGTEYTSIVAMARLIRQLDPKTMAGTVIVAPLLNVPSFERMTVHVNPVDRKGMNSSYPGDANGTQTPRALALVAQQVVQPADVVVDLHGGDLDEDLRPYSYLFRTGNATQDSAGQVLAMAFGLDHVILRDLDMSNPASRRSLSGYSLSLGKTVLVAEAGYAGTVMAQDVTALVEGAKNVLGTLKVITRPVRPLSRVVWLGADSRARADSGGMFFPTARKDARVTKGTKLGYTTDYLGRPTGDVLAPATGLVTFIRPVPSMWKDATLATVAEVLASLPPYKKPGSP
jgi:predicted deacylase